MRTAREGRPQLHDSPDQHDILAFRIDLVMLKYPPIADSRTRARRLVMQFGWNSTAYQILNPRMNLWFSDVGDAVIGYVVRSDFRIVAGAPVCSYDRVHAVVEEFECAANLNGEKVCYFGAAGRLQTVLASSPGHGSIAIGEQPVWNPQHWKPKANGIKALRGQVNRAVNKGVTVIEWVNLTPSQLEELSLCLREWLDLHVLPPLHFLTETVNLHDLGDRRLFTATVEPEGSIVGYLIATPVPDRNGWLIEQIVRGNSAPNGVSELMVDTVMRNMRDEGFSYLTLGLAPLSRRTMSNPRVKFPQPLIPRLVLAWVRTHGNRFYNFEGIERFKAKFRPDAWEPITVISNETTISLRALSAAAAAFSSTSQSQFVLKAALRALRNEAGWMIRTFEDRIW